MKAMSRQQKTMIKLVLFSGLMFGFGYALVPFYTVFCNITGLNQTGLTEAPRNSQVDLARVVNIEFDANVHDMPWRFRPLQGRIEVHPGELTQVEFEVVNTRSEPVTGQAIPSYAPGRAGEFFKKLSCFCFSKQTLAPGERRIMPVVFTIDRELPRDVGTITLSYTFFEVEGNQRAQGPDARIGS